MFLRKLICKKNLLITIVLLLTAVELLARAGGAGGNDYGGGGGGGGDGDGIGALIYLVIRLITMLPFPANVIVAAIAILIFYIMSRQAKKKLKEQTILNQLPTGEPVKKIKGYNKFMTNNPGFDEDHFKRKVETAFLKIQEAWEKKDLSDVRKFISDGVYQRFNTQFLMMNILKQTNRINDLKILNIYIDRIETDGKFDIIHTAVHARIDDRFVSEIDSSLNSGGEEEFVEYWSFIKKRGTETKDIYSSDFCPNCGSPLPEDMGEVSKCPACGTLTNSGEYDWVLSEITQADDYIGSNHKLKESKYLAREIERVSSGDEEFSLQNIEDKASNGYLQIISSMALGNPSMMRRFVNDNVFNNIKMPSTGETIAYNRLYLNDVYVLGISEDDTKNHIHIAVKSSYQRVRVAGSEVEKIDEVLMSRTEVLVMSRDKSYNKSKGSLYAHCCPSCGAPVENSLKTECDYCGSTFNSTSSEWIITELMSLSDYSSWLESENLNMTYSVNPSKIDKLYDVRDFALNNVMILIAADGIFSDEEREFAETLAKKWGYNLDKISPIFDMAMAGNLSIKMPDDSKKQRKIYKLMGKAAMADHDISPEEMHILETIKSEYGIQD